MPFASPRRSSCEWRSSRSGPSIATHWANSMSAWRRFNERGAGFIYDLSESLALVDRRYPGTLEAVSDGVMVIVSDYSGQHKLASHEAYSFLVTTGRALNDWLPVRLEFRNRWLPDGRHLSFKELREPVRWRALIPFLEAASAIRGNVITFLVDRRIKSFMDCGTAIFAEAFPDLFSPKIRVGTVEKMFRVSSFLAMLTAGLREEHQRSLWISDSDETLETFDRRSQFALLTHCLTIGLTHWRDPADMDLVTTASAKIPPSTEDVASISDLIAGACCQLNGILPTYCGTELWRRVVPSGAAKDRRARVVGNWMATTRGQLRQVLLRLELGDDGLPHASAQRFVGPLGR